MAETTEQYRNRINQLKTGIENEPYIQKMRENIAEGISKTGNRQADIEVRQGALEDDFAAVQQDARSNTPSGAELAVAAGPYNTLGERLDAEEQKVTAQLAQTNRSKADITYVDQSISRMSGGAIKGTYTTLNALKNAYPNGAVGPFMIEETGDRYIWDVNKLSWVNIGPYEPAEIPDKSITTEKYADNSVVAKKTDFLSFYKTGKNIFNIDDPNILVGKMLNSDGSLSDNINYSTSGYMFGFKEGDKISVSRKTGDHFIVRACEFSDIDRNFVSGVSQSTSAVPLPLTVPAGAVHLRITYTTNNVDTQVEVGEVATAYEPYKEIFTINKSKIALPESDTEIKGRWEGKTIIWNGDSVTQGNGYKSHATMVCERLLANLVNYAIGGSTLAVNPLQPTQRTPIVTRWQEMQEEADLVVMAIPVNDWAYSWTDIGTMESRDIHNYYGALHTLFAGLTDKYMAHKILITTPIKRGDVFGGTPLAVNGKGLTLRNYCEIIIEVAGYYGLTVLDLNIQVPILPFVEKHVTNLIPDKVHPNDIGQSMIADREEGFLQQY